MGLTSGIVIYSCCWWVVGCLVDLDPCCLLTEHLVFEACCWFCWVTICHGIAFSCFGVMRMVNSHTYLNINQRLVKLDYTNRHLSNSITFPVNLSPVQVDRIDRPFSRTFAQRLDLTMICLPKHCTKVNQTFNFTYLLELEAIRRFSSNIKYLIE